MSKASHQRWQSLRSRSGPMRWRGMAGGIAKRLVVWGGAGALLVLAVLLAVGIPRAQPWILGVEEIRGPLPIYNAASSTTRALKPEDPREAATLLLARSRFWKENGHLEALVFLHPPEGTDMNGTFLTVRLLDAEGKEVRSDEIHSLPGSNLAFYPALPRDFGGAGSLALRWVAEDGQVLGEASAAFEVESSTPAAEQAGRIAIRLPNPRGVVADAIPFATGVPFPRGILEDVSKLRLVDESGRRVPAQFTPTARWSKFGPLKWVRCDFTADLTGQEREFFLEYGKGAGGAGGAALRIGETGGFPGIDAGRLRLDDGIWYAPPGTSSFEKILDAGALVGGFVEHEDGRVFRIPAEGEYEIEEEGPRKVVVRRAGWYQAEDGAEFCKYEVRWVVHRDSPLLRIFHTWIFTGDSDVDRIRNMGWQLPYAEKSAGGEFLTCFGPEGEWIAGDFLLQHDFDEFEVMADGKRREFPGGRAPGVARVVGGEADWYFGARDFWQAFPSELEFREGSLWFHAWPRHGRPRRPVDPANAVLLQFAHSGELLDLRLPEEYTRDPIDMTHCGPQEHERVWARGRPSSINAQGVARTEEFWLLFQPPGSNPANVAALMEGINEETIRPVVDPAWVMGSGAFFEAHHQDRENHPRFEEMYEQEVALLDSRWAERLGIYGMWLHGEALWNVYQLHDLYRSLRKGHGGYGRLSWLPYARSGDPRLLKRHDAAMRRIIDANFRHHVTEEVAQKAVGGGNIDRRVPGFWICGAVPWAAQVSPVILEMSIQPHQWWSAWHMTNYHRARDMAATIYPELAREHARDFSIMGASRTTEAIIQALIDSYENTFDPWFLTWAHALAQQNRDALPAGMWQPYTRNYMPGDREFHRFTGCPQHRDYYLDLVAASPEHRRSATPLAYAWLIGGGEEYLRRAGAVIGELEEMGTVGGLDTRVDNSWDLPMALGAFERAGFRPPGRHLRFPQRLNQIEALPGGMQVFRTPVAAIKKADGKELPLSLRVRGELKNDLRTYWIYGPDGKLFVTGEMAGETDPASGWIEETLVIPAEAAGGVYWLFCEIQSTDPQSAGLRHFLRGLHFPVSPPGTPEVLVLTEDRMGPTGHANIYYVLTQGYFFRVPEEAGELRIDGILSQRWASIWSPDGELVWEHREPGTPASAEIAVRPEHRGRLWRIRGGYFTMDPKVPPVFAIDADRWFDPGPMPVVDYPAADRSTQQP